MSLTLEPTTRTRGAGCCAAPDQQLSSEAPQQCTDDLLIIAHPIRLHILTMLARSSGQVCASYEMLRDRL